MRTNQELQKMLVEKTQYFTDRVPVFKVRNQNAEELLKECVRLASRFTAVEEPKELRYSLSQKETNTVLQLQDDATFRYYHASGYKHFERNTNPAMHVVSENAEKLEKGDFEKSADQLLEKNRLNLSAQHEDLRFEKLWQLKSAGVAPDGTKSAAVVNRLVHSYRRFIDGLPVWGSASVFIKTAADYRLDAFGIDWRSTYDEPLTMATIIDPHEAAKLALEQLQNLNPEIVYTPTDFTIESFALGYFSHSKTVYQSVMQPVYIAKFISKRFSKMGHIVTVPAAGTSYENICRKVTPPPFNLSRTKTHSVKEGPVQK